MSQFNTPVNYGSDITKTAEFQQELAAQRSFMNRVYAWMTGGLVVTSLSALVIASSHELTRMFIINSGARIGMMIAWFAVSLIFIFAQNKISAGVSAALFVIYSALTGVTVGAVVLLVFSASAVVSAFAVTAGMFLIMTVYGYVTKRDLTSLGSFMMMGLFGLILASLVTLFMGGPNPMMLFVMNMAGVIIFTGLTAYDTQKIKQSYAIDVQGGAIYKKAAIYGAFSLYLDFVNLFLYLVQLFGRRD